MRDINVPCDPRRRLIMMRKQLETPQQWSPSTENLVGDYEIMVPIVDQMKVCGKERRDFGVQGLHSFVLC